MIVKCNPLKARVIGQEFVYSLGCPALYLHCIVQRQNAMSTDSGAHPTQTFRRWSILVNIDYGHPLYVGGMPLTGFAFDSGWSDSVLRLPCPPFPRPFA